MVKKLLPVTCECCNHNEMVERSYSGIIDSYFLECPNCQHEQTIHFTKYDIAMGYYDKDDSIGYISAEKAFSFFQIPKNAKSKSELLQEKMDRQYEEFKKKWAKK